MSRKMMTQLVNKCASNLFVLGVLFALLSVTPSIFASPKAFRQEGANSELESIHPNVLLIFADDQRPDTISALGNDYISTPSLDRLVREGVYFSNAHCFGSIHGAVCQPSRAMLHTGRSLFNVKMDMSESPLIGELLGDAGYETFGTGKWHNGRQSFARSFQTGKTIMFGGMSDHTKVPVVDMIDPTANDENNQFSKVQAGPKFSSEMFVDSAIDFLQHRDLNRPFFCYVALTAPHDPRQPPLEFRKAGRRPPLPGNFLPQHPWNNGALTLRDEVLAGWPREPEVIREQLGEYYGLIEHADNQVGRLLSTLDELRLSENTIVIYAADHGLALGSHGLLGKQSLYEHSMGTPVIIRGPGIAANQKRDQLIYLFDLMPTICKWAGLQIPSTVEGEPLQAIVADSAQIGREYLFTAYTQWQRAIRDDQWKLIVYPPIQKFQLFDLKSDPLETKNLYGLPEFQGEQVRLSAAMEKAVVQYNDKVELDKPTDSPLEIDFSKIERKPDQWQPDWIVDKYFPNRQESPKKESK